MKKIKIEMLEQRTGYDDHVLTVYQKGQEYEVGEDLANNFLNRAKPVAKLAGEKVADAPVEQKKLDEPENKAMEAAPENKSSKKGK